MKINKLSIVAVLGFGLLFSACTQNLDGTHNPSLEADIDSVSYALGFQNGDFFSSQGITDIDIQNYIAGLNAGLNDDIEPVLNQEEVNVTINRYVFELNAKEGEDNLAEGQAFLEENIEKEGVMETESGLQYKVIEEGSGVSPQAEDTVVVHYIGRLLDGTVFDTSRKEVAQENDIYSQQREPYDGAEFPLNRVIKGWNEGVQLMSEGAVYELYIPSDLAYGPQGPQGSAIGANETLIFEVELLEVKKAQ
ncbi:FKBP-type peptidyl-prolyl cis-trans isomerase [Gracilimonas sp.]|uniref:FKBP-type peptidyl-prolyl cis-trans isomerase n=1 Tax=Gracilimonas sp. TaxID=1974203 RepID=UPI002871DBDF|nr:FKBP-type peptidyl-prolyl cis-trans isomerase [Gracilimonas sp.]